METQRHQHETDNHICPNYFQLLFFLKHLSHYTCTRRVSSVAPKSDLNIRINTNHQTKWWIKLRCFTPKSYIPFSSSTCMLPLKADVAVPERDLFKHKTYLVPLWFKGKETTVVVGTYCLFDAFVVRTQSAQYYIWLKLLVVFKCVCLKKSETDRDRGIHASDNQLSHFLGFHPAWCTKSGVTHQCLWVFIQCLCDRISWKPRRKHNLECLLLL